MPWWLLMLILMVIGWLLINAAFRGYDLYGEMILEALPESVAVEATRKTMSYGAEAVMALYFGWLYLPILALLLLPVYALAEYLRYRSLAIK